jgi:hypothetical protein
MRIADFKALATLLRQTDLNFNARSFIAKTGTPSFIKGLVSPTARRIGTDT